VPARDRRPGHQYAEAHAARHLAEHTRPALLELLQQQVDQMTRAVGQREYDLDIEFRRLLSTTPSNRRLLETWSGLMDQVRTLLLTKYRLYDDSQDIACSHQVLLDAVRAADPALTAAGGGARSETAERVLRELAVEASALQVEA
jgi:DNA-binding FadR family transcriptional regulator